MRQSFRALCFATVAIGASIATLQAPAAMPVASLTEAGTPPLVQKAGTWDGVTVGAITAGTPVGATAGAISDGVIIVGPTLGTPVGIEGGVGIRDGVTAGITAGGERLRQTKRPPQLCGGRAHSISENAT